MIYDSLNLLAAEDTDFANETGTANVGDYIDLGAANADPGNGQPVYLVIQVDTAADGGGGGNATVAFQLASDSTTSVATNGDQTIHFTSDEFTAAQLTAGRTFIYPLPVGEPAYERYMQLQLVTGTEGEDALTAHAFLTLDPSRWAAKPDALANPDGA